MIEEDEIKYLLFRMESYIKRENSKDELFKDFNENDVWRSEIYDDLVEELGKLESKITDIPTSKDHAIWLYNAIEDYIDRLNHTTNFCRDTLRQKYGYIKLDEPLSYLYIALVPFLLKVESFKGKLERFALLKRDYQFEEDWMCFFNENEEADLCLFKMQTRFKEFLYARNKGLATNMPNEELRVIFISYASKSRFEEHYKSSKKMIKLLQKYNMDGGKDMWDKKYFQKGWQHE